MKEKWGKTLGAGSWTVLLGSPGFHPTKERELDNWEKIKAASSLFLSIYRLQYM